MLVALAHTLDLNVRSMANHEQAVVDSFNLFIRKKAEKLGNGFRAFSLDGQDALAGADYILSDTLQFSLVEFKFTERQINDEKNKDKRLKLCEALENNPEMRRLHDKSHFIAWMDRLSRIVNCNIYRLEVCNQSVFGPYCVLTSKKKSIDKRVGAKQFAEEFFSHELTRSLSLQEFEVYLKWILEIGDQKSSGTLELLTLDEKTDECQLRPFRSVRMAYDWMQQQNRR